MKRFVLVILCALCLFVLPLEAKTYTSDVGQGWRISGADLQNCRFLSGNMGVGINNGGDVWYVDGNRLNDDGDGTTWETAKKLLSSALALSHADIAVSAHRQWASRNTIYIRGDTIEEDLTALAQKTDIRGTGNNNPYNMACLKGNHDIVSTTAYPSCRFYNVQFFGDEAGELWDVDGQGGLEFQGCLFQPNGSATVGLEASECTLLKVQGCTFMSIDGTEFSSSAIEVPNDTTAPTNYVITGNVIQGAIGINWDDTDAVNCWISDNYFVTTGLWIDDESDTILVVNNRAMTAVDTSTSTAGYDFALAFASGNIQTGSTGVADTIPFAKIAE